jgi:hypothetical protein
MLGQQAMPELLSHVLFPFDSSPVSFGRFAFETIRDHAQGFMPKKFGTYEPLRRYFALAELEQIWDEVKQNFFWKTVDGNRYGFWAASGKWRLSRHSSLSFSGRMKPTDPSILMEMFKALSSVQIDFACIHDETEAEVRKYGNKNFYFLDKGIPSLCWGTLFGRPYVKMIGLDRLMSAPAFKVEKWTDELVFLQITANCGDVEEYFLEFDQARIAIKNHLGEDLFQGAPSRRVRIPKFIFRELPWTQ